MTPQAEQELRFGNARMRNDLQRCEACSFCFGSVRIGYAGANREGARMRIILLLIIIVAIFAVVQTKRHNCEWGDFSPWLNCVIGKTAEAPATMPASTPSTEAPASETPQ